MKTGIEMPGVGLNAVGECQGLLLKIVLCSSTTKDRGLPTTTGMPNAEPHDVEQRRGRRKVVCTWETICSISIRASDAGRMH